MDRRKFLKVAGLSFGGILISENNALSSIISPSENNNSLCLPSYVKIVAEEGREYFIRGEKNEYVSGDIHINIKRQKGNELLFSLYSPTVAIKHIIVGWHVSRPVTSLCLGDHWERGYGDLQWMQINKDRIMPWYFMEYDGLVCNGFGVKTGANAFCYWKASTTELSLVIDTRNGSHGVRLGHRILNMVTVIAYRGKKEERPFISLRRFCLKMCPNGKLASAPIYGINDWYFAYGNNSDDLIMQTVDLMSDLVPNVSNRPFCLIDAGWAVVAPGKKNAADWSDNFYTPGSNFKDMGATAIRIKSKGMRPGLWMRPLCASHSTPSSYLLSRSLLSSSAYKVRDPSIPENIAYINKCFSAYHQWGYEIVKHDFSTFDMFGRWGNEMIAGRDILEGDWMFYDKSKTNAEIVLDLYRAIRRAANNILIIGCNTISHLAAGLFEAQRIGDDTSGREWARTKKMGVNSLAFRGAQHNIFYAADADCVGLTTEVDWRLNRQWMELVAGSGTPLFISAQPQAIGNEQRDCIRRCFNLASSPRSVGEPIDWMETLTPSHWMLDKIERVFNWD